MKRFLPGFLLLELVACLFVFRSALWSDTLLAPLDIAPTLLSKYRFVTPDAGHIPANHYIVDQIFYDLPVQRTIYHAIRRGEIPWWDPYTYGGRPLLADAHINGTDPIRLALYALLPFEPAYNWTRVLHFILGGVGMLVLLRRLRFDDWICVWLAVTYQFAGGFTMFFGHPWIQSAFVWYPFLWVAWDAGFRERVRWALPASSLAVAAVFYAGNLQSHAYLVLFGLAVAIGYGHLQPTAWRRLLPLLIGSGVIGGLLALPVLSGQLELFLVGDRRVEDHFGRLGWLGGLGSLSSVFPWCLGTFRTLDLSKVFGHSALGFTVWIGSAAAVLAWRGAFCPSVNDPQREARNAARGLVFTYLLIVSTPLVNVFYQRSAPLALLGLVVLAAQGIQSLRMDGVAARRYGHSVIALAVLVALGVNLAALGVYPRVVPKVRQLVEGRLAGASLDAAPDLREAQIASLPAEVSFHNPEALAGGLGLLALGGLLSARLASRRSGWWQALFALNLLPLLLFAHRFIPHEPIAMWQRLLQGGAEQQRVIAVLAPRELRLSDEAPGPHDSLFPAAFAHFYGVRLVEGYAALQPRSLFRLAPEMRHQYQPQLADYIYRSIRRNESVGELIPNATPGLARFQWISGSSRSITPRQNGLNRIEVTLGPGPAGELLWTDTWFPGWTATIAGQPIALQPQEPAFSRLAVPAGVVTIRLEYRPRFLRAGMVGAALGVFVLIGVGVTGLPGRSKRACRSSR